MRPTRLAGLAGVLLVLSAATSVAQQVPKRDDSPKARAAIAKLEAARDKNPRSMPALRALGVAYYKAGRPADALPVLQAARTIAPGDGVVALYLGLSAEATGDLATAKTAYESYLKIGRASRVRRQLSSRLAALHRRELAEGAKAAVAQEASLVNGPPPSAMTIAVLPLRFNGTDQSLAPLERGLADLLVTDLARSSRLTVVERDRMQAIVDELSLNNSAAIDQKTALRSGKIIRAGRVVNGAITQMPNQSLRVDAALVDVVTTQALTSVQRDDKLEQLFSMEKALVFQLFDALGVRLTPAERQRIEERPTRSIAAFLAYSQGLLETDKGNLDAASQLFDRARAADPAFRQAGEKKTQVEAAKAGASVSSSTVEAGLAGTSEGQVVAAATNGSTTSSTTSAPLSTTAVNAANDVNQCASCSASQTTTATTAPAAPTQNQNTAQQNTGTTNPGATSTGKIVIIIKQP